MILRLHSAYHIIYACHSCYHDTGGALLCAQMNDGLRRSKNLVVYGRFIHLSGYKPVYMVESLTHSSCSGRF
jgi:hypothetical protein